MNYAPFQRSYMHLTTSLPHIKYLFTRRQYTVGISPTKSTVCIYKITCAGRNHFHDCVALPLQISTRHKHSSGRSTSEAALCFGNLRVYEPSGLHKKPSDMRHSSATNICLEIRTYAPNVGVILLTHTMPLQVLV